MDIEKKTLLVWKTMRLAVRRYRYGNYISPHPQYYPLARPINVLRSLLPKDNVIRKIEGIIPPPPTNNIYTSLYCS